MCLETSLWEAFFVGVGLSVSKMILLGMLKWKDLFMLKLKL